MRLWRFLRLITLSICFTITYSCNRFKAYDAPSTEFSSFVKAYTGGAITEKSTVRIEFVADIPDITPGETAKPDLFRFSPAIEGNAHWVSQRVIEFVPESGSLIPGQKYKAMFRLDKIMKIADRKLRKFPFSFIVARKEASISIDNMLISEEQPDYATVVGTISLSEAVPSDEIRNMLSYEYDGDGSAIEYPKNEDDRLIPFIIRDLERDSTDKKLTVRMKPGKSGFKINEDATVIIPAAKKKFEVISAKNIDGKTPYIVLSFSQPLEFMDEVAGFVTLDNAERYYSLYKDNSIYIYYEGRGEQMTVTVSEDIKSYDGQALGAPFSKTFSYSQYKPAVSISLQGNILPDTKELILPFKAVSLKAVDLSVVKIYEDNILSFLQYSELDSDVDLARFGRLVYKKCIRLDTDPDKDLSKWQNFSVDLSGMFKQEPGAIYRIRLTFKKDYSIFGKDPKKAQEELIDLSSGDLTEEEIAVWDHPYGYYSDTKWSDNNYNWSDRNNPLTNSYYAFYEFPEINLMTSNLGVIAKYSGSDKMWVNVTDILNAKPVFGVDIEVYNFQMRLIGRGKTNAEGIEELNVKGRPFAVVAKRNGVSSYVKVLDNNQLPMSNFDVGGVSPDKGIKSYIYGERGVWRPGDTLHVTMIVQDRQKKIPDNHPSVMEFYSPTGQFHSKIICSNATDGFYYFDVPTKSTDPTGIWNAYFKLGGASFHKSFRIESIKPNRIKINLSSNDKILKSQSLTKWNLRSAWLAGSPAANLQAKGTLALTKVKTTFKGFEAYNFNNPASRFDKAEFKYFGVELNDKGESSFSTVNPKAMNAPGMLNANITCTVLEKGGDASIMTYTMPFSPFSSYVGVKSPAQDNFIATDREHVFQVAVLDENGKRVKDHTIEYRLYKMEWSWWMESNAEELDSYVNGTAAKAVMEGNLVSDLKDLPIRLNIKEKDWGRYFLYIRDIQSGHSSGCVFNADNPQFIGRADRKDPSAIAMLSFTTDKKSYEVGENVTVYIPAVAKGRALVSIENTGGVLSQEWVSASATEDTKYSFKVTSEMAPNFYVNVSLIQPHKHLENDLPIRLYGAVPVLVNDKTRHLNPVITMPDKVKPEETFSVKVSEKNGKTMTYTLAIVDEGLLDLTAFKTPDPFEAMNKKEALGVKTWDLYDKVIGAYSGKFSPIFRIGGDAELVHNAKKDNRFNPIVKFLGPFTLKSGSNTHKIKLPMYVGSVRVMLVAGHGEAFGKAEKNVKVQAPLMIIPSVSKTLSVGDEIDLALNVFAMEKDIKNVNINIKAEGGISVNDAVSKSISFSSPGDKLVRFRLKATKEGMSKVYISANGIKENIEILVRNPNPPIVENFGKIIEGKSESTIELPDYLTDTRLTISSFPLFDYNRVFEYFTNYRYNCSEQLSSMGLALLSIKQHLSKEKAETADRIIQENLKVLYGRQLYDGGFGYWEGASNSDTWVTSMAGLFMIEALNNGYEVNKGVLGNWLKFQQRNVLNFRQSKGKMLKDLDQAYRLFTLTMYGNPDNAGMNRLKESKNLSMQARTMLAASYGLAGKKNVAEELLNKTEAVEKISENDRLTYGSELRNKAIALETYTIIDKLDKALELAGSLSSYKEYYNTQELAFISFSMNSLSKKIKPEALDVKISQNGSEEKEIKTAKAEAGVEIKSAPVMIQNNASGSVYASIMAKRIFKAEDIVQARQNGMRISIEYFDENDKKLSPDEISQGRDFYSLITVYNTNSASDYSDLALTQIVPSGWEIIKDLSEVVAARNNYEYRDIRDDRCIWYFNLGRGLKKSFKTKFRAGYSGRFILPSVICEGMYRPEINANTESGHIRVTGN